MKTFGFKKKGDYFQGKIHEANHGKKEFSIGDRVKILPSSPKFSIMFGVIQKMMQGSFGDGRIWAEILLDDKRTIKFPLGSLRRI